MLGPVPKGNPFDFLTLLAMSRMPHHCTAGSSASFFFRLRSRSLAAVSWPAPLAAPHLRHPIRARPAITTRAVELLVRFKPYRDF